jgi:hypothetical protein
MPAGWILDAPAHESPTTARSGPIAVRLGVTHKEQEMAIVDQRVPPTRKMQYMDSVRDWQGQPLPHGTTQPVVIDLDPILYSEPQV